jgi:hypothetical protein
MVLTDAETKEFIIKYNLLKETLNTLKEAKGQRSAEFINYLIDLADKTVNEIHDIIYENLER